MGRRWLAADSEVATELRTAVRTGDLASLVDLVTGDPTLAAARLTDANGESLTALHLVVEWPGHFPGGAAVTAALLAAGADANARWEGGHPETPLHWAATVDDAEVVDAMIDGGADIEARGAAVGGGTALDNAVGYGCWLAAHQLVRRGAQVARTWHAAALGMTDRLGELLSAGRGGTGELNMALWHACRAGQRRAVEFLLDRGADLAWAPPYDRRPASEIVSAEDTRRRALREWLRAGRFGDELKGLTP